MLTLALPWGMDSNDMLAWNLAMALKRNGNDYHAHRIDHEAFQATNRAIWDKAERAGLDMAVCEILNRGVKP